MTAKQEMIKEIDEMRETFNLVDVNGDGSISKDEIGFVIRALGHCPTQKDVDDLMRSADEDNNGRIEFPEFLTLYTSFKKFYPQNINHLKEMRNAFNLFDEEGDKMITVEQFRRIMSECGEKLTKNEVDDILKDAYVNEEGLIKYEDFIRTILGD